MSRLSKVKRLERHCPGLTQGSVDVDVEETPYEKPGSYSIYNLYIYNLYNTNILI